MHIIQVTYPNQSSLPKTQCGMDVLLEVEHGMETILNAQHSMVNLQNT